MLHKSPSFSSIVLKIKCNFHTHVLCSVPSTRLLRGRGQGCVLRFVHYCTLGVPTAWKGFQQREDKDKEYKAVMCVWLLLLDRLVLSHPSEICSQDNHLLWQAFSCPLLASTEENTALFKRGSSHASLSPGIQSALLASCIPESHTINICWMCSRINKTRLLRWGDIAMESWEMSRTEPTWCTEGKTDKQTDPKLSTGANSKGRRKKNLSVRTSTWLHSSGQSERKLRGGGGHTGRHQREARVCPAKVTRVRLTS